MFTGIYMPMNMSREGGREGGSSDRIQVIHGVDVSDQIDGPDLRTRSSFSAFA